MTRRARAAALLLGALLLAGCGQPLPQPSPQASPADPLPALGPDQVDRVLSDVTTVVSAADAAALAAISAADGEVPDSLDSIDADLQNRLSGPAAAMRRAQYVLATQGGAGAITSIPAGSQTVIEPATDAWPRVLMVVTDPPKDLQAPLLLTLVQTTPRDQYHLWSWARLYGGVKMPPTATPDVGSRPIAADDAAAAVAPKDVLARYVDVLTNGDGSKYASQFTTGPLRTRITQQRDAWKQAIGQGSVTETYTAGDGGPWALATADGGAIVVGSVSTVTTLTLVDSTLTIADATAALLGANTVSKELTIHWLSTVAFSVPPAGSEKPITVLGAEHVPVEVTGS
ncbi:hypothetical protein Q6348_13725 [Isoptericola sp. b441]|uniref:DUF8094 domain-containing protein n=1 Tax=Actinotalea lenta TaxID=3064654 RepID=A0ABT9DBK4_9CELL|nr:MULTISPECIES: hypothetical protein [unclassified Isoptericola]MDO8108255.1 hypothetical protein [Isoptericola sp. b441]MDO8120071.1 hypothetical protein [Isoptericola sp. b490]